MRERKVACFNYEASREMGLDERSMFDLEGKASMLLFV